MAHTSVTAPALTGPLAWATTKIEDLKARYTRYQVYRTTRFELMQLSDRELADLAISRSMIRSIAYKAAYE